MDRSSTIELSGARLEAAWWGTPSPLTLVLLHEGLGSVGLWRDFPARLAAATGCAVFAWSRAGYGRSNAAPPPWPPDYMQRQALTGVGPVLDAAGIGRCVLVGHSDGASIATVYAGGVGDPRVRGLVLIAPHVFVEDMCLESIRAARDAYDDGNLRTRLARHHDHVDDAFRGWNGAWLDPAFRAWDITDYLAYIRVPMLLVQGEADPYGTRAQTDTIAALAYAPVETAMLPGARHAPHLEAPKPTMAAIRAFIAQMATNEGTAGIAKADRC